MLGPLMTVFCGQLAIYRATTDMDHEIAFSLQLDNTE